MSLKIIVKNAQQAFECLDQVNDQQLRKDIDYTWRYTPAVNSWLGDEIISPATVEFNFTDSKWETYFGLKWSR